MGLQISCGFYPEAAPQGDLWPAEEHLGEVFHELARQKEARIEEGHLMPDHVHRCISIPPKYAVASVVGSGSYPEIL